MLKDHGFEIGHSVRVLITQDCNEIDASVIVHLPVSGRDDVETVNAFQSLVGSLLWIFRCTQTRHRICGTKGVKTAHQLAIVDYLLVKKIALYMSGAKTLCLFITGQIID